MRRLFVLFIILFSSLGFAKNPTLTVILDWYPNPDHAPLIIANEKGYFKEQGLTVNLIGPADPNDAPKLVAAKKADIGITYQPQLMEQIDRGLPLIRIGTLIDKPLSCLVALKESGIQTLADLKGKRIGSTSGGMSSVLLKTMLASKGIKQNDVSIVNVKYNLTQALLSHQVDAVTGMMRNFEVPMLELQNKEVVVFFPEEHGIPNYSELVFISHLDNAKDARIVKFLNGIKKAVAFLDSHPDQGWQLVVKRYPEANNQANHEAWFTTLPYFAEEPASFDNDEWQRFGTFMRDNKLIEKLQLMSRYAVLPEHYFS